MVKTRGIGTTGFAGRGYPEEGIAVELDGGRIEYATIIYVSGKAPRLVAVGPRAAEIRSVVRAERPGVR